MLRGCRAPQAGPPGTKLSPLAPPAGDTGTKLSRHTRNTHFRRILRQQGEFYTASANNKPRRENFVPHSGPVPVQNSPGTPQNTDFGPLSGCWENFFALAPTTRPSRENFVPHAGPVSVQNSPGSQPRRAQPVQNSPSTPEIPLFGAFCASRESFIPLPPTPSRAGRRKSRTNTHLAPPTRPSPNFACNSPK